MSLIGGTCPKCGGFGKAEPYLLMSNPPQKSFTCTNQSCKCQWLESVGEAVGDGYVVPTPGEVTWAVPDYVKRAAERDEEKHALHVRFMEKQLATMDAEAAYRAVLQEHHIRQTEALEGILVLLRKVQEDHAREREEDRNRSCVVMD